MTDPAAYGRSFADVYDDWYADVSDVGATVAVLADLAAGGPVLEMGIGTGRIALPLQARGVAVRGIDASEEMVATLRSKPGSATIPVVIGDLADPEPYGDTPVAVAFCGFNTLYNLAGADAQGACLANAAAVLRPGGSLVVEAAVVIPPSRRERRLEVSRVEADRVVLIATDAGPGTHPGSATVVGQHIELSDDSVRLRPWRLEVLSPAGLDGLAARAGLTLADRWSTWQRTPFEPGDPTHISVYSR